jgi:hypothetical protein
MNYNFDKLLNKKDDIGCGTYIVVIIFLIAFAFGISCLHAWIGMLLWNWVMPMIWASAPVMTFWPMWGLLQLCGLLFKTHNFNSNKSND